MSDKLNDGGGAFPACNEATINETTGMTLRDYFAAQALPVAWKAYDDGYCGDDCAIDVVAPMAYEFADAMLAERAKSK